MVFPLSPVAPETVELRGPTEARQGEIVNYHCSTSNSNPPATIRWTVGNQTRKADHTHRVSSPHGGWITHSNVSVSLGPGDRSKIVVCNAANSELNEVKSESKMLSVICEFRPFLPALMIELFLRLQLFFALKRAQMEFFFSINNTQIHLARLASWAWPRAKFSRPGD